MSIVCLVYRPGRPPVRCSSSSIVIPRLLLTSHASQGESHEAEELNRALVDRFDNVSTLS